MKFLKTLWGRITRPFRSDQGNNDSWARAIFQHVVIDAGKDLISTTGVDIAKERAETRIMGADEKRRVYEHTLSKLRDIDPESYEKMLRWHNDALWGRVKGFTEDSFVIHTAAFLPERGAKEGFSAYTTRCAKYLSRKVRQFDDSDPDGDGFREFWVHLNALKNDFFSQQLRAFAQRFEPSPETDRAIARGIIDLRRKIREVSDQAAGRGPKASFWNRTADLLWR